MGQVPVAQAPVEVVGPNYLIAGDGRLGRHLRHALGLLGLRFRTWSRRENPGVSLAEAVTTSPVGVRVLLAVSDGAIEALAATLPSGTVIVHFSGALITPRARAAHPLGTFSDRLLTPPEYRQLAFVIEAEGPPLAELLPGFTNPSYAIPSAARPLYHALCVLAGPGTTLLWQKLFGELESRWGIPRAAAIPYLRQITKNLETSAAPLTGPFARQDRGTIAANLAALGDDSYRDVYAALARAFTDLPRCSPYAHPHPRPPEATP